ncbi:hypothetical protein [Brunnivagina elsteri]|nr:hypothetical protein [Calothrix elsteri]
MVTQEGASHKFPNILIALFVTDGKVRCSVQDVMRSLLTPDLLLIMVQR